MAADLHSLTYFSRNTMVGSAAELEAQVGQILASARRNNQKLGVTGALLFSHDCFAQVLEGELEDVETIYNRILPDTRHADIRILQFTPITARSFGGWAMAYAGQTNTTKGLPNVVRLLHDPACIANGEAGRQFVEVLEDIMGQYDSAVAAA